MTAKKQEVAAINPRASVVVRVAGRFGVDPDKMLHTLKSTAFRSGDGEISNEQMMALLVVADQYKLNPWTREIYAFPDKKNGIVPVVGVDGWSRIINEHPQFDGMEFGEPDHDDTQVPAWILCVIYRKDRQHPIAVKEYFDEVKRETVPWKSHPRRMLRHKAMIQCARLAFGFAGIFDPDEADRIIVSDAIEGQASRIEEPRAKAEAAPATITKAQRDLILKRLDDAGLDAAEFCSAFELGAVPDLPADQVNDALKWIDGERA